MKVLFIMGFVMPVLAACASTHPVFLQHPKTGETVQCGPYTIRGIQGPTAAAMHEARCLDDYQRQGYERVPK